AVHTRWRGLAGGRPTPRQPRGPPPSLGAFRLPAAWPYRGRWRDPARRILGLGQVLRGAVAWRLRLRGLGWPLPNAALCQGSARRQASLLRQDRKPLLLCQRSAADSAPSTGRPVV